MGLLEDRRSIRSFAEKDIPLPLLEEILLAGMCAPSPKNRQPWHFLVLQRGSRQKDDLIQQMQASICRSRVQTPARAEALDMALESLAILDQAPSAIFICYRPNPAPALDDVNWSISATDQETIDLLSVGAAVENMLLKAHELGLGGLWCGDILYAYQTMVEYLHPENPIVSAICLGYPAEHPLQRPRASLANSCTFLS